jgi:hypothetical protein
MYMLRTTVTIAAALLCINGVAKGAEHLAGSAQPHGYEELKKERDAMRLPNVAWRSIQWETCLLKGLRASRKKNKPLILWIFIDLPIDDKRC